MVFSLAIVAVVCAVLDSNSGMEPWFMTTAPIHLKLLTSFNFSPLTLMSMLMPSVLLVISLDFSALISMLKAEEVLPWWSTRAASSFSFPFKPSMSSAKRKLVIVLSPMLTLPLWFSSASFLILSRRMLKTVGWGETALSDSECAFESVSYTTIKVDCTGGLVVEFLNDLDQVAINVIKPHGDQRALCHALSNSPLKSIKTC